MYFKLFQAILHILEPFRNIWIHSKLFWTLHNRFKPFTNILYQLETFWKIPNHSEDSKTIWKCLSHPELSALIWIHLHSSEFICSILHYYGLYAFTSIPLYYFEFVCMSAFICNNLHLSAHICTYIKICGHLTCQLEILYQKFKLFHKEKNVLPSLCLTLNISLRSVPASSIQFQQFPGVSSYLQSLFSYLQPFTAI